MNNEKIKKIIIELQNILTEEIAKVSKEIKEFQNIKDIDLANYPNAKQLYRKNKKQSKISSFLPPSKNKLKNFIYKIELEKLYTKLEKLKNHSKELEENIKSLSINGQLKVNASLLTIYLKHTKDSIDEILKNILSICHITETNQKSVLNRLSNDIAEQSDENGNIKKDTDFRTIKWLFEKMYIVLFGTEEAYKMIEPLIEKLDKENEKLNPQVKRKEKTVYTKEALKRLELYVQNGRIIRPTNKLEDFERMLNDAEINDVSKNKLLDEMKKVIENGKDKEENNRLLKKYLSNQELSLIDKALALYESNREQKLYNMIEREINHIISLCKYLEFNENILSEQTLFEDITSHIDNIRIIVNSIKNQDEIKGSYMYIAVGSLPVVLNSIRFTDLIHYNEIYDFLNNLNEFQDTRTLEYEIDGIKIESLKSENFKLFFCVVDNELIIIDITNHNIINRPSVDDKTIIAGIKKIKEKKKNPKFRKIQETYERMIVQSLNLDRTIQKRLFK